MKLRSSLEEVVLRAARMGQVNRRTMRIAAYEVREESRRRTDDQQDDVRDEGGDASAQDHDAS